MSQVSQHWVAERESDLEHRQRLRVGSLPLFPSFSSLFEELFLSINYRAWRHFFCQDTVCIDTRIARSVYDAHRSQRTGSCLPPSLPQRRTEQTQRHRTLLWAGFSLLSSGAILLCVVGLRSPAPGCLDLHRFHHRFRWLLEPAGRPDLIRSPKRVLSGREILKL